MELVNLLIDTNIALYFLAGDKKLAKFLDNTIIHLSFISELELLSYSKLNKVEQQELENFINDCIIININDRIKKKTVQVRQQSKLNSPDAIIAATAITEKLPFLSADKDFQQVRSLQLFTYEF